MSHAATASTYTAWPLIPAMGAYLTAPFDQRSKILTVYRNEASLQVGGCPGLSYSWIRRHESAPNERPRDRLAAIDTPKSWDAVKTTTSAFNGSKQPRNSGRVAGAMKLQVSESHNLDDPGKEGRTFGDLLSHTGAYALVMVHVKDHAVHHICAAYCAELVAGSRRTAIMLFDPNFGEFEFGPSHAAGFVKAWMAQFATYVTGAGQKKPLSVARIEVMRIDSTTPTETAADNLEFNSAPGRARS